MQRQRQSKTSDVHGQADAGKAQFNPFRVDSTAAFGQADRPCCQGTALTIPCGRQRQQSILREAGCCLEQCLDGSFICMPILGSSLPDRQATKMLQLKKNGVALVFKIGHGVKGTVPLVTWAGTREIRHQAIIENGRMLL